MELKKIHYIKSIFEYLFFIIITIAVLIVFLKFSSCTKSFTKIPIKEKTEITVVASKNVSESLDCHIVSSIKEEIESKIDVVKESPYLPDSKGEIYYSLTAIYDYYVNWDKFNIYRDELGNTNVTFSSLKAKTPIGYKDLKIEHTRGLFVTLKKLNNEWENFTKNGGVLDEKLIEHANSYSNMATAEKRATESLKQILSKRILPLLFPEENFDNLNKIKVIFKEEFEPYSEIRTLENIKN